MAVIRRRRAQSKEPYTPSKMARMATADIILATESALMNSQQYLDEYRRCDDSEKGAALAWIRTNLDLVHMAVSELEQR